MNVEIKLTLKSPLVVGDKSRNNNYRESLNYIPGNVLRAAYVNAILDRCLYDHKNRWLEYKNEKECRICKFNKLCKEFSNIEFPTLYPLGGQPYPITAREKKYLREDISDVLIPLLNNKPIKSDWVQLNGFHKNGKDIKLINEFITKTSIDYGRRSAKHGLLYSLNAISEILYYENNKIIETSFTGVINLSDDLKTCIDNIKTLDVGQGIKRGNGYCSAEYKKANIDTEKDIKERINNFNKMILTDKIYITIDLLTDAYLEMEKLGKDNESLEKYSNEVFLSFLKEKIALPEGYKLVKVYKTQEVRKGYDTSKPYGKRERDSKIVVKAGSVFVYTTDKCNLEELLVLQNKGIGKYTEHGFGKVKICDSFHYDYVLVDRGENNG